MLVGHWMSEVRRGDACQNSRVRIETWTLEGKWSPGHLALLDGRERDVRRLTEMPSEAAVPDATAHRTVLATSDGGAA